MTFGWQTNGYCDLCNSVSLIQLIRLQVYFYSNSIFLSLWTPFRAKRPIAADDEGNRLPVKRNRFFLVNQFRKTETALRFL